MSPSIPLNNQTFSNYITFHLSNKKSKGDEKTNYQAQNPKPRHTNK